MAEEKKISESSLIQILEKINNNLEKINQNLEVNVEYLKEFSKKAQAQKPEQPTNSIQNGYQPTTSLDTNSPPNNEQPETSNFADSAVMQKNKMENFSSKNNDEEPKDTKTEIQKKKQELESKKLKSKLSNVASEGLKPPEWVGTEEG